MTVNAVPPFRLPAEWERHRATWIAWPHHEPDWPGKFAPIPWVYAEIARVLADHEQVEILCQSEEVRAAARDALESHGVRQDRVRRHMRIFVGQSETRTVGQTLADGDELLIFGALSGG